MKKMLSTVSSRFCILFALWNTIAGTSQAAQPEPDRAAEVDDIAANLNRFDGAKTAKGVEFLEQINAYRDGWRTAIGLDISASYHTVTTGAFLGDGVPTAAGGDLTLQGIWKPGKLWRDNPAELRFRARYRHSIGDTPPSALGKEIGALWGTTDGFTDRGFEMPDFYLRHYWPRTGIEIRYGQMTIDSQLNSHEFRSSKQAFLNQAFSASPAVAFPRYGAGFTLVKKFHNGVGITIGASNVQGTSSGDQVNFKFDSKALFEAVQMSYDFADSNSHASRLQLLLWRSDAAEFANIPEGRGASFIYEHEMSDGLKTFLGLAWSDGDAAAVEALVSGGVGKVVNDHDLVGLSAGVGRGSDGEHPVQAVVEGFYRWQIREGIRITGDIQILAGEGFRENPGLRTVVGFRTGFDF